MLSKKDYKRLEKIITEENKKKNERKELMKELEKIFIKNK